MIERIAIRESNAVQPSREAMPPSAPRWLTKPLVLHSILFLYTALVWGWHLTPAANILPGATGFGRYARYLTFCTFTAQLLLWAAAVVVDVRPTKRSLALVDDAACAILPVAATVTVLFYTLLFLDPLSVVEPGRRPEWLSPAMHWLNTVAALLDAFVCQPRSFSRRAAAGSLLFVAGYAVWIQVVRSVLGVRTLHFPRTWECQRRADVFPAKRASLTLPR